MNFQSLESENPHGHRLLHEQHHFSYKSLKVHPWATSQYLWVFALRVVFDKVKANGTQLPGTQLPGTQLYTKD